MIYKDYTEIGKCTTFVDKVVVGWWNDAVDGRDLSEYIKDKTGVEFDRKRGKYIFESEADYLLFLIKWS